MSAVIMAEFVIWTSGTTYDQHRAAASAVNTRSCEILEVNTNFVAGDDVDVEREDEEEEVCGSYLGRQTCQVSKLYSRIGLFRFRPNRLSPCQISFSLHHPFVAVHPLFIGALHRPLLSFVLDIPDTASDKVLVHVIGLSLSDHAPHPIAAVVAAPEIVVARRILLSLFFSVFNALLVGLNGDLVSGVFVLLSCFVNGAVAGGGG